MLPLLAADFTPHLHVHSTEFSAWVSIDFDLLAICSQELLPWAQLEVILLQLLPTAFPIVSSLCLRCLPSVATASVM